MQRVCPCTVRLLVLLLLWCDLQNCQHTTDHRKVPQRSELQQGSRAGYGATRGSWGAWGAWSACSRTCGRGVQEQSRPCLPAYVGPSPHLPPGRSGVPPGVPPGVVISALRPSVPLHRDPAGPLNGSRADGHRRNSHIFPGRYGFGRTPFVAPLQTHAGRRRRSTAGDRFPARVQGALRAKALQPNNNNNNNLRHYNRPHTPPARTQPPAWAPLYQPGSEARSSERPYDPLPAYACPGDGSRYRVCNSNACSVSSKHFRAAQCSSYNTQPFMGRLYEWEPFNEVPVNKHCELNCRAVGFKFYVRLTEKVIDGTPCGLAGSHLCVNGNCTRRRHSGPRRRPTRD